jgi:hypothetical protein
VKSDQRSEKKEDRRQNERTKRKGNHENTKVLRLNNPACQRKFNGAGENTKEEVCFRGEFLGFHSVFCLLSSVFFVRLLTAESFLLYSVSCLLYSLFEWE